MIRKSIYIITFLFVLLTDAAKAQDRASDINDNLVEFLSQY